MLWLGDANTAIAAAELGFASKPNVRDQSAVHSQSIDYLADVLPVAVVFISVCLSCATAAAVAYSAHVKMCSLL